MGVVTLLCLSVMSAGGLTAQVHKRVNPFGGRPEAVAAGRQLFNRSCTNCHGADGAEGERGPALAATRRYFRLSDDAIFEAIKRGIAGSAMPAIDLPDEDIWRIVVFIRSLRATASDHPPEGDVENGRRIFAGKGRCRECHMIGGEGGFLGPDLSSVGGERSLAFIREVLTKPRPAPKAYRPVKVVTAEGVTLEGIAKNEDAFSLQVLGRDHKLYLLERDGLREIVHAEKSIMPDNYDKTLAPGEMRDLLAFLSRQALTKTSIEQAGANEVGR